MRIKEKIDLVSQEIVQNGNTELARRIAFDGLDSIIAGMRTGTGETTPEWRRLMSHFTDDADELKRLCGEDPRFNDTEWGLFCLAYIAGDSTCTSDTTMRGGTLRSIRMHDELAGNNDLKDTLDVDFPNP